MLDEKLIADIRESGIAQGTAEVEHRAQLLTDMGFRTVDRAEYALIASCFLPSLVPEGMKAFRLLLEYFKVDYTLLRKEYCCGNLLLRQAAKDKTGNETETGRRARPRVPGEQPGSGPARSAPGRSWPSASAAIWCTPVSGTPFRRRFSGIPRFCPACSREAGWRWKPTITPDATTTTGD